MRAPELFGAELQDFMKRAVKNLTRITAFGEEQPKIENRLELAAEKDEFGMPLGRIIHSYDDNDAALWNANFEEGVKIARATDAKEVWQGRAVQPTIHLMGGTIMGTGAANSVVNSFGQTHEIPNLYVAGPGIFATAGRVEPDLYDLCAVAARGGEFGGRIGGLWRGRACSNRPTIGWVERKRNPIAAIAMESYSGLMPATRMTLSHFLLSSAMRRPNSAGVSGKGAAPRSA